MINPRELRLNNYIKYKYSDLTQVSIPLLDMAFHGSVSLEPIPITEDFLIKTELRKLKNYHWSKLINNTDLPPFYIQIEGIEATNNIHYRLIVKNQTIKVLRHIHELQNIWIDLTGEELEAR